MRGATGIGVPAAAVLGHFNPRTPCGVRPVAVLVVFVDLDISTHAPLAGCDGEAAKGVCSGRGFQPTHPLRGATVPDGAAEPARRISTHAPLAGCDQWFPCLILHLHLFQPTHPLRGATRCAPAACPRPRHFNPRTPCGVRLFGELAHGGVQHFNPRTPCGVRPSTAYPAAAAS